MELFQLSPNAFNVTRIFLAQNCADVFFVYAQLSSGPDSISNVSGNNEDQIALTEFLFVTFLIFIIPQHNH